MKCRFISAVLAVCTMALSLSAQNNTVGTIAGKVVDSDGQAVPGATIVLMNAARTIGGTVTDLEGSFSMKADPANSIMVSCLGYVTQTVKVGNTRNFSFVLQPDSEMLGEVVVVGYGAQKKETLTGSISVVRNDALIESPTNNLSNALVGRVAGVSALQSSGEPGDNEATLRIRGIATLNSEGQDPLVVIDGVQSTMEVMNTLDPNEIQSVSVLKDASATAVYGVQGANGVVIVTTRRGTVGTPKINVSYRFGITELATQLEMLDSYRYALLRNEAIMNDGDESKNQYLFDEYQIWKFQANRDYTPDEVVLMPGLTDAQRDHLINSPALYYRSEDWYDKQFGGVAPQQQFNINISGGGDRVRYFTSVGWTQQDGLFRNGVYGNIDNNTHYNRYNFRSNIDVDITRNLKLSVDLNGSIAHNRGILGKDGDVSSAGSRHKQMLVQILSAAPFAGPGILDGKLVDEYVKSLNPLDGMGTAYSATAYLIGCSLLDTRTSNMNASIRLDHEMDYLTRGLKIGLAVSYHDMYKKSRVEKRSAPTYKVGRNPEDPTEILFFGGVVSPTDVTDNSSSYNYKQNSMYLEGRIEYNRTFNRHSVSALALFNAQQKRNPGLQYNVPSGMLGSAFRATYSYDNRYFVEFDAGYNGSENFPEGKRFGFFPAASLGWILTNEPFFPENNILTYFKIRASYGEVGNDKVGGSRYLYLPSTWAYTSGMNSDGVGGGKGAYFGKTDGSAPPIYYEGAVESRLGNPDVTWERARKTNIGVDFNLFKDKVQVNADIFNEDRNDILWNYGSTPGFIGATPPMGNIGKMNNKGYEVQITYADRYGDFFYSIGAGASYSVNKILYMDEPENPYYWMNRTGYSYGQYKGYHTDGFYNNDEEAMNRPYITTDGNKVQAGDIRYIDLNGDGIIDSKDVAPIGYSNLPRYTFNGNLTLGYKGFLISALFTGAAQGSMPIASHYMLNPFYMQTGSAQGFHYDGRWTPEKAAAGKKITWPRASLRNEDTQNGLMNELYLQSTDFFRLKNLEVSYTFKSRLLQKAKISAIRVYANGNNLFTVSKMLPGYDPEQSDSGGAADGYLYPLTRSYNMGVNIQF